jgi:cytochrome c556
MNRASIPALLSMLAFCVVAAAATQLADKTVVEARQASMKAMAASVRLIAGMFSGKVVYDVTAFRQAAGTLRSHAGALAGEFPALSLGPPSAARPEIEQARAEFAALANHMETLAGALSAAANAAPAAAIAPSMRMGADTAGDGGSLLGKRAGGGDIARMPAEHLVHLILQDCTSCHAKFRQKSP